MDQGTRLEASTEQKHLQLFEEIKRNSLGLKLSSLVMALL